MVASASQSAGLGWLAFALMTVGFWGLYGILLHAGQMAMGDPVHARYKAFLFVGIAYFLIAVVAPCVMLWVGGATWSFTGKGMGLSLIAGVVGAAGAFCVLLAFGAKGTPSVVMTIVFAGAPIVNAVVGTALHGGFGAMRWQFAVGILMAAVGGGLVTLYRPMPRPTPAAVAQAPSAVAQAPSAVAPAPSGDVR